MTKRVLVISGDQYHPASDVMEGLLSLAGGEFVIEQAPLGPLLTAGEPPVAIVLTKLNVSSPTDLTPWVTPEVDQEIGRLVESGTGLLVIHAGTVGYGDTSQIRKLTGGQFLHHPEPTEVTVESVGDAYPMSNPLTIWDEHYFVETDPTVQVFLEARSIHGRQPAGWMSRHGSGRVCVLTPGHFAAVWQDAGFLELVRYGLETVING